MIKMPRIVVSDNAKKTGWLILLKRQRLLIINRGRNFALYVYEMTQNYGSGGIVVYPRVHQCEESVRAPHLSSISSRFTLAFFVRKIGTINYKAKT